MHTTRWDVGAGVLQGQDAGVSRWVQARGGWLQRGHAAGAPIPHRNTTPALHACPSAPAIPQTGQYSTQIFSLAVLLSSLFVFNQMGGIDEAALDR